MTVPMEPTFDATIHAPQRLQICALLARGGEVEFATLRDALDVSDATLSKHLRVLTDAGYVVLRRVQRDRGHARTWAGLTRDGRRALDAHFAYLSALAPDAGDLG
ncbi:transcriptional regulator [Curtobacterium sp. MCBD17_003]|uniref:transcriptional regulator n=2 Tax=Curtobacterium TaxID=2034 RepID=UPI0021AC0CB8|nr:transcriptional regulator [Curtobacterium sp. MCBD17_003]WIE54451.1 transcriptional regulator [Curtobacterium sp. MCBD17_003]